MASHVKVRIVRRRMVERVWTVKSRVHGKYVDEPVVFPPECAIEPKEQYPNPCALDCGCAEARIAHPQKRTKAILTKIRNLTRSENFISDRSLQIARLLRVLPSLHMLDESHVISLCRNGLASSVYTLRTLTRHLKWTPTLLLYVLIWCPLSGIPQCGWISVHSATKAQFETMAFRAWLAFGRGHSSVPVLHRLMNLFPLNRCNTMFAFRNINMSSLTQSVFHCASSLPPREWYIWFARFFESCAPHPCRLVLCRLLASHECPDFVDVEHLLFWMQKKDIKLSDEAERAHARHVGRIRRSATKPQTVTVRDVMRKECNIPQALHNHTSLFQAPMHNVLNFIQYRSVADLYALP